MYNGAAQSYCTAIQAAQLLPAQCLQKGSALFFTLQLCLLLCMTLIPKMIEVLMILDKIGEALGI